MVHFLHLEMQSLLRNLMMRFIHLKYLTEDSTAFLLYTVQVNNRKKQGIKQNWYWNKSEMSLSRTRLVALWKAKKVSENVNLFKFLKLLTEPIALAHYIYPKKRLDPGSTSAISSIALNIGRVMKNCSESVFDVSLSENVECLCDSIRTCVMHLPCTLSIIEENKIMFP